MKPTKMLPNLPVCIFSIDNNAMLRKLAARMMHEQHNSFSVSLFSDTADVIDQLNQINDAAELPKYIFLSKAKKHPSATILGLYDWSDGVLVKR